MNPSAFLAGIVGLATSQKVANQLMATVRQSMAQLVTAINQNTNAVLVAHGKPFINFPTPNTGGAGGGSLSAAQGRGFLEAASAAAKFRLAVMAAADSLSRIAGAANPDVATLFNQSFQMVTAAIGTVVAPAVLTMAAGALVAADKLKDVLGAAFGDTSSLIRDVVIPVVATLVNWFVTLAKVVVVVWECFLMGVATLMRVFGQLDAQGWKNNRQASWNAVDRVWGSNVGGMNPERKGAGEGNTEEAIKGAFKELAGDLKTMQGQRGNTGFSGIADVWKTIQQNSFQTNMQLRQVKLLEQVVENGQQTVRVLQNSRSAIGK